ncbi:exonuclease VII small subunit [Rhizobium azooxidifex]|uniref:Exonuclease VII small subunit n=1 Tax=Mycoplana azooxidifex TaxID=1636188 RepID=A0A7W6D8N4_9HYPH|nr:hypothetical protein [Mycoplana azooxidifex]MBB3976167.1 exonuclease VII small subunit [Mycoplana azooxidifex]
MRKVIAGLAFVSPLLLAGPGLAEGEGRYQMERTAEGFVRLDTVTGEVSLCKEASGQMACRMAADERAAFEVELDSLTRRVEALEKAEKSALSDDKPRLPTDEEIDRTMGIMERMMRRLMAIVKNLEGEEEKIAPQQPVPEKT